MGRPILGAALFRCGDFVSKFCYTAWLEYMEKAYV